MGLLLATLISSVTAVFFGKELLKKFEFVKNYTEEASGVNHWHYPGAKASGREPGMYNVVIQGEEPFAVLVGFEISPPLIKDYQGVDWFGFARSDRADRVVLSIYLGEKACDFIFLNSKGNENLEITSAKEEQKLSPQAEYPPHWFQKVGF